MADEASQERFQNFREAFSLFGRDDGGFITQEELARVIGSFGRQPTEEELREMIEDREGIFEFLHFFNRMTSKIKEADTEEEELQEAFKVFDNDQNGFISPNELRQVMMHLGEKLTEEEAEQMIKEADLDGDGLVNYDDFVHLMTSLV